MRVGIRLEKQFAPLFLQMKTDTSDPDPKQRRSLRYNVDSGVVLSAGGLVLECGVGRGDGAGGRGKTPTQPAPSDCCAALSSPISFPRSSSTTRPALAPWLSSGYINGYLSLRQDHRQRPDTTVFWANPPDYAPYTPWRARISLSCLVPTAHKTHQSSPRLCGCGQS